MVSAVGGDRPGLRTRVWARQENSSFRFRGVLDQAGYLTGDRGATMGKMVKLLLVVAVIGGGIALAMNLSGGDKEEKKAADGKEKEAPIQVQEKYGFAPIGVTGDL